MRNLFIVLLFSPLFIFGQSNSPYEHFTKDQNKEVIYQNVFNCDSLNESEISAALSTQLKTTGGINNVSSSGSTITFNLEDFKFDHKKYGYSALATSSLLSNGVFGNGFAEVKNGKYRVTITNLIGNKTQKTETRAKESSALDGIYENLSFSGTMLKTKNKDWSTSKLVVDQVKSFDDYLTKTLTLKKQTDW